MSIVNGSLQNARATTAAIAASSAVPLDGQIVYNSQTGQYKIGDGVTTLSALSYYGGSGALTIGTTTITSGTNTRILYNNSGVVGEYTLTGSGTAVAMGTSPVFTTDITTPLIIGGTGVGSVIQYKGTSGNGTLALKAHEFLVGNNGATSAVKIYNNANIDINGQYLYMNGAFANAYISNPTGNLNFSSPSSVNMNINGTFRASFLESYSAFSPVAVSSGAVTNFIITTSANTNQTLSTNIPNFKVTGSTKQWATGTVPLQYFNWFTSNTTAAGSASNFTVVANLIADYVQGGTNATNVTSAAIYVPTLALTNTTTGIGLYVEAPSGATTNLAARLGGDVMVTGNAIYLNKTVVNSTNHSFYGTALNTYVNAYTASGTLNLTVNTNLRQYYNDYQSKYTGAAFSGTLGTDGVYMITPGAAINLTAGTEINMFKIPSFTWTWNTGALATQKFNVIKSPTVAFNGASTLTDGFNLFIEEITAGANCSGITNNYSLGTAGKAKFGGNVELTQTVTTEALVSDTSVTVVINGTTYKLLAKA